MPSRILIVDDESSASEYLRLILQEDGHSVRATANGVEALIALETNPFDLVISDIRMPQMDGLELLTHLQQRWPDLPAIMLTANDGISDVVEAVQLGAVNYLVKPSSRSALSVAIDKALRSRPYRISLDSGVPELVGQTPEITEVRHRAVMAARSDVHVMITGDTGTGKELVARAIHHHSAQSKGPFVPHNCALAPAELFESEFFGHRRGSFTGAERDHKGLLSQADGGVLFLDELEAMPLAHQAKLLRVIDDGEVRPVGAEKTEVVSVRFVAATNRDPGLMMQEKTLREDLYYRLRGVEIALPTLSERRADIPLLASHFSGVSSLGFSPDAMEVLCAAPWPGNVRQLRNTVQGARAIAGEARIGVADLPVTVSRSSAGASSALAPGLDPDGTDMPQGLTLRQVERWAIERALQECDGNRTRTAEMLDIDRSTLRRKMTEYGI